MTATLNHPAATTASLTGRGPAVRPSAILATLASAAALAPAVWWLIAESQRTTGASSDIDLLEITPDPTSGAVLLVLALVLCFVPFMVGRAAARRSSAPLVAAGTTVAAVGVGLAMQLLFS